MICALVMDGKTCTVQVSWNTYYRVTLQKDPLKRSFCPARLKARVRILRINNTFLAVLLYVCFVYAVNTCCSVVLFLLGDWRMPLFQPFECLSLQKSLPLYFMQKNSFYCICEPIPLPTVDVLYRVFLSFIPCTCMLVILLTWPKATNNAIAITWDCQEHGPPKGYTTHYVDDNEEISPIICFLFSPFGAYTESKNENNIPPGIDTCCILM